MVCWRLWCQRRGSDFLVGMAERDLVDIEGRGGGAWECYILPIWLGGLGSVLSSQRTRSGVTSNTNFVHYICHRNHLVEEKFSLFVDNYSDTNKPRVLRISWKPEFRLHNNEMLILSWSIDRKSLTKKTNIMLSWQKHWLNNEHAVGSDSSSGGEAIRSGGMSRSVAPHFDTTHILKQSQSKESTCVTLSIKYSFYIHIGR